MQLNTKSPEVQRMLEKAREDLLYFFVLLHPEFVLGKHQYKILEAIMRLYRGETKKLCLSLPPGHSKSLIGSICFPAFILGNDPTKKVTLISYGSDLAGDFGSKSKLIMESTLYRAVFPEMVLLNKGNSTSKWDTTTKDGVSPGGLRAVGRDGAITGFRNNFTIVDDLVKSQNEAKNKKLLDSIFDNYDANIRSRMLPTGGELIIMTRWSPYDVIGRLLEIEDDWEVINFEAECTNETLDPLGRKLGEFLWEDFYPKKWYIDRKKNTEIWQSLYQGNPKAFQGSNFKASYWSYYNRGKVIEPDLVFLSMDTASKKDERNDYSVCVTWFAVGDELYAVDFYRDKIEFPELVKEIKKRSRTNCDAIVIEDASSGIALSQTLARWNRGVEVCPVRRGNKDKEQKLMAVLPEFEAHKIHIPVDAVWTDLVEEEFDQFGVGAQDDIVDAFRIGIKWFYENQDQLVSDLRKKRSSRIADLFEDPFNRKNRASYRTRKYKKGYHRSMNASFG